MNAEMVGVNKKNYRVGVSHHRAKITDHEVDLIRQLRDEGMMCREIAEKFEIGESTVWDIVKCKTRAQYPARWRRTT